MATEKTHVTVPEVDDPILAEVRDFYETHQAGIERARRARRYFYNYLTRILQTRIPPGQRVLDVGCGTGDILAALRPSIGVGIDVSAQTIERARELHADTTLRFIEGDGTRVETLERAGGPFDVIVLVNVITHLTDVQRAFEAFHSVCHARTRILIYSYSRVWQPILRLAEQLRLKYQQPPESWLPPEEVENMLRLADFEALRRDYQILFPINVPPLSSLFNKVIGHLPGLEWLSLLYGIVARPTPGARAQPPTPRPKVSIVIPCRNEGGHIRPLVERLRGLGPHDECLFVEGNSIDDTESIIRDVIAENPRRPFRLIKQAGRGKGDAVRLGFAEARGDLLVILDSDMGVAPEDLPKFVDALVRGKGELINGSRMVYPMEGRAMRFLNLIANKLFALLFSWLLGQQIRDTLCGTKALFRDDYERIAANRAFFGDFDPFGDFDLLFGASRLNLRVVDLPVRYHERRYGETNISRFRHGLLLLRMSLFAARKLKFI